MEYFLVGLTICVVIYVVARLALRHYFPPET